MHFDTNTLVNIRYICTLLYFLFVIAWLCYTHLRLNNNDIDLYWNKN